MYQQGEVIQSRYEVKEVFLGGMGIVYITYDRTDNKFLALKTIQAQFHLKLSRMERFVREAKIWIALGSHPNIVKVYRLEQVEGLPYIFMEYVIGTPRLSSNLRGWILKRAVDIVFALDVALQVCAGLSYAQSLEPSLVHRDLKPENLLIDINRIVKIADFGLAKALEEDMLEAIPTNLSQEPFQASLTRTGRVVGTPPYMSPEQCFGLEEIDFRSDIYSLGCVLYEMLTGEWLLNSHSPTDWITWHTTQTPYPPSTRVAGIPSYVDDIVLTCLQKRPQHRYQSYTALSEALECAYEELTGSRYSARSLETTVLDDYEGSMNRVRAYFLVQDYKLAKVEVERLIAQNYETPELLISKGALLLEQKQLNEAMRCYDRAIELAPSSNTANRALINKGTVYMELGQYNEAISMLTEVILQDPGSWHAWNNLGIAYEFTQDLQKALECYDKSLSITPWQRESWVNRGRVLNSLGRRKESKQCNVQAFQYSVSYQDRADLAIELIDNDLLVQDDELVVAAYEAIQRANVSPFLNAYFATNTLLGRFEQVFKFFIPDVDNPIVMLTDNIEFARSLLTVMVSAREVNANFRAGKDIQAREKFNRLLGYVDELEQSLGDKQDQLKESKLDLLNWIILIFLDVIYLAIPHEFSVRLFERIPDSPIAWVIKYEYMFQRQDWQRALYYLNRLLRLPDKEYPIFGEITKEEIQAVVLEISDIYSNGVKRV